MPNSLMDLYGSRNAPFTSGGFGDAIADRSNSLIGLGLGLMSSPGYGDALRGYMGGASMDASQAARRQSLAQQEAARKQAQSNWERSHSEQAAQRQQAQQNWEKTYGLQERAAEGGKVPPGWQRTPEGGLGFIPGGPADPKYLEQTAESRRQPRQFSVTDINKLSEEGGKAATIGGFVDTFEPRFAGYGSPTVGGAANVAGRYLPEGVVGKDVAEGATWWQGYDRYKNVVRNELFGSALTANEQSAFERADINPGMNPEQIKRNLVTQKTLAQVGLKRKANALLAAGYDPAQISATYGLSPEELGIPASRGGRGAPPPTSASGGPVRVNTPDEARKLPSGTPILLPDGSTGRVP